MSFPLGFHTRGDEAGRPVPDDFLTCLPFVPQGAASPSPSPCGPGEVLWETDGTREVPSLYKGMPGSQPRASGWQAVANKPISDTAIGLELPSEMLVEEP